MLLFVCLWFSISVPDVNGYVVEPAVVNALDDWVILEAALGSRHSLILTEKGLVSVGCNDSGQLGRTVNNDGTDGHPGRAG